MTDKTNATSTQVCAACFGAKKLLSLGNMWKDCWVCDGVGHVSASKIIDLPRHNEADKKHNNDNVDHSEAPPQVEPIDLSKLDKRSKAYREAIGRKR